MKTFAFTLSILLLPILVFAEEGFVALSPIPGFIDTGANITTLPQYINNIFYFAIMAGAIIAVFQLIRAGLLYMTVEAITEKKEARQLIVDAIIGLVLLLSVTLILNVVNPQITNLNLLNFDALRNEGVIILPSRDSEGEFEFQRYTENPFTGDSWQILAGEFDYEQVSELRRHCSSVGGVLVLNNRWNADDGIVCGQVAPDGYNLFGPNSAEYDQFAETCEQNGSIRIGGVNNQRYCAPPNSTETTNYNGSSSNYGSGRGDVGGILPSEQNSPGTEHTGEWYYTITYPNGDTQNIYSTSAEACESVRSTQPTVGGMEVSGCQTD